uniref:Uncharacterized protein n=1 Tax=Panagrellus redivivus TaxID=6233 RepID=A0A7E4VGS6_PANRE
MLFLHDSALPAAGGPEGDGGDAFGMAGAASDLISGFNIEETGHAIGSREDNLGGVAGEGGIPISSIFLEASMIR